LKGGGTIAGIEAKYAISKEIRTDLETVVKGLVK
jgi:hypothetical protein